jgi:hypothetical protein
VFPPHHSATAKFVAKVFIGPLKASPAWVGKPGGRVMGAVKFRRWPRHCKNKEIVRDSSLTIDGKSSVISYDIGKLSAKFGMKIDANF